MGVGGAERWAVRHALCVLPFLSRPWQDTAAYEEGWTQAGCGAHMVDNMYVVRNGDIGAAGRTSEEARTKGKILPNFFDKLASWKAFKSCHMQAARMTQNCISRALERPAFPSQDGTEWSVCWMATL